jgi:hypothetical protein
MHFPVFDQAYNAPKAHTMLLELWCASLTRVVLNRDRVPPSPSLKQMALVDAGLAHITLRRVSAVCVSPPSWNLQTLLRCGTFKRVVLKIREPTNP